MRIVCTDKARHPSRELAVLELIDDPELYDTMRADGLGSVPDEVEAVIRDDQVGHSAERRAARGGVVRMATPEVGQTHDPDAEVGTAGDGRGSLWRFRCPTCGLDVQLRGDTLHKILVTIADTGRVTVDLSALPPTLA